METLVNVEVPKQTIKIVDKEVEVNFTYTQKEYVEKKKEEVVIVEKIKIKEEVKTVEVLVEHEKYEIVDKEVEVEVEKVVV